MISRRALQPLLQQCRAVKPKKVKVQEKDKEIKYSGKTVIAPRVPAEYLDKSFYEKLMPWNMSLEKNGKAYLKRMRTLEIRKHNYYDFMRRRYTGKMPPWHAARKQMPIWDAFVFPKHSENETGEMDDENPKPDAEAGAGGTPEASAASSSGTKESTEKPKARKVEKKGDRN